LQSSKIFFLQKTQKNILICVYLENAFDGWQTSFLWRGPNRGNMPT
jgi:hypothetical protein